MPVILKFQSTGAIPGALDRIEMGGDSITLGRGDQNDVVLPDPDRMLSKRHCAIENHNGNVVIVDFSTNGTFLNYGKIALGPTPTPLNNGDILSVGPYEIQVDIASDEPSATIAAPVEEGPIGHGLAINAPSASELLDAPGDGGDFLDDLLVGRDGPVGPGSVNRDEPDDDGLLPPLPGDEDLLPPAPDPFAGQGASGAMHNPSASDHMSTPRATIPDNAIPDDWDDAFLSPTGGQNPGTAADPFAQTTPPSGGGGAAFIPDDFGAPAETTTPPPKPEPIPVPDPDPEPEPVEAPQVAAEPAPVVTPDPTPEREKPAEDTAPVVVSDDAAARAFLKSLGGEDMEISDAEMTPTMSRMGHVLRIMIEGLREILMTRTSIKSEFRIEQTMIQAGGNNPLKFSISPDQAIEAMVKPKAKGYLDATDATAQALKDIKAHEVATITGMEAALKGVLSRLDPKSLEEKITSKGGLGGLLKSKKARYWEIYEEMYADISDQAENDFQELFAKEFARAYKEQLDKLK